MIGIYSALERMGFNAASLQNKQSSWRIYLCWSSCDHDNWLIRRNRLKDTDMRLDVSISQTDWKVTFEIKHNLYRLVWTPSGCSVMADLVKYSRMTRWPELDNILDLPELIVQLEQLSEFKQKNQTFSKKVRINAQNVNLETEFDSKLFAHWLRIDAADLILPDTLIDEDIEEDEEPILDIYPSATSEPGYPFKDPNLKIAVMDSLLSEGLLELGTTEDFHRFIAGQCTNPESTSIDMIYAAKNYLARYPLTTDQLSKVTRLDLDGSSKIYYYLDKFYDGETQEFFVRSLAGIEACPALRDFSDSLSASNLDLSPLTLLSQLETISLDGITYQNTQNLLDVHSLKLINAHHSCLNQELIRRLNDKNVKVNLYS